jgi:sarcosine oxidase, subunit beta
VKRQQRGNGLASRLRRPARYSALGRLRRGLTGADWPRSFRQHDLEASYDAVIVGAGVHGLATTHYLAANNGISKVAVLDKGYLGGGARDGTSPSSAPTT